MPLPRFKTQIKVRGSNETINNVKGLSQSVDSLLQEVLNPTLDLFQQGAKGYLDKVTNPVYSTKKLSGSIQKVVDKKNLRGSVGPDRSATNNKKVPYAEWVEFGHYMTGGKKVYDPEDPNQASKYASLAGKGAIRWWPGHHYMQHTYETYKEQASDKVKVNLIKGVTKYAKDAQGKISHLGTGAVVG